MFGRIALRIIFGLVIVALLVGGAFMLYRAGAAQGYLAGVQASGSGANTAPAMPNGYLMPWGYYWPLFIFPFFSPLGFIFPIIGVFILIWLVTIPFRMMGRRRIWRHMTAGGPGAEAWAKQHEEHFAHMREFWEGKHSQTPPEEKK